MIDDWAVCGLCRRWVRTCGAYGWCDGGERDRKNLSAAEDACVAFEDACGDEPEGSSDA
jgi:hypothetical protein